MTAVHTQEKPGGGTPPPGLPKRKKPRHAKRRRGGLISITLGIVVLLLPIAATLYNDYQLDKIARAYSESIQKIEPKEYLQQYIDEAHAYNEWLAEEGHHAMEPVPDSPGYDRYMETLSPPEAKGMIARLVIPTISVNLPVYHTTHPRVLHKGAGHMFGSDLPVGGQGRNSVLSAHTGMVNASMFDNLPRIKDGADVYVEVMGTTLQYRVTGRQVVKPDEYDAVEYIPGKDVLTLITCTPYGLNTDRLLVTAERVEHDGGPGDKKWTPNLSWWMIAALAIIAIVLLTILIRERKRRKTTRTEQQLPLAT